jgi:hypothetical protein
MFEFDSRACSRRHGRRRRSSSTQRGHHAHHVEAAPPCPACNGTRLSVLGAVALVVFAGLVIIIIIVVVVVTIINSSSINISSITISSSIERVQTPVQLRIEPHRVGRSLAWLAEDEGGRVCEQRAVARR